MTDTLHPAEGSRAPEWTRVNALLDDALDRESAERGAFLDAACGEDAALRTEVGQLLLSCEEAEGFLEIPARELGAELLSAREAGIRIGPYRTIGIAGRGGMGIVYLAERADDQFQMQVAIKILPTGMESGHAIRRFLEERQILARLQHPGIARLLDGGVTQDGLPYFVMEYVEGTPLDRYADEHQLDIRDRLTLFCRVCEAVEYAHQNLVVHRDIKPGNILVTAAGEVKLLDFGIARLVAPGSADVTQTSRRFMTPEYASPEQVRGEPVTTRSDVYALGVVLYRVLAGRSPYEMTGRTPREVEQAILEVEPQRPSDVAVVTKGKPPEMGVRLRGDLDAIVLRAMRKDPSSRYTSAEALRQDVLCYLDGRAVKARPGTRRYRVRRFIRRHRVSVAAGALIVLSLLGGIGAALWQARVAARAAARAERVKSFLVDIFDQSDPERVNGDSITARQLLDAGARRIDTQLRDEPETRAEMYLVLGGIYRRLGMEERADSVLARGAALTSRIYGSDDLRTADVLEQQAYVALDRQRLPAAEKMMRDVLRIRSARLAGSDTLVSDAHAGLANVLNEAGHWNDAEGAIRIALRSDEARPNILLRLADHLELLSSILEKQGQTDSAIATARRALSLRKAVGGADRLTMRVAIANLGRIYKTHGEFAAAETLYRQAVVFDRSRLGLEHRITLVDMSEVAAAVDHEGKLAEAERLQRDLLEPTMRVFTPTHPFPYVLRNNLAHTIAAERRFAEAEPLMREAYEGLSRIYGPDHPDVVGVEASLAATLALMGKMDEAEPLYTDAVTRIRRLVGDDNPRTAAAMMGYSEFLLKRHKPAVALPLMRQTVSVMEHALKPEHPERLRAESVLGACLVGTGHAAEGMALLRRTYDTLLRTRGKDDLYTVRARERLADGSPPAP
ncbi:hypothetical protein BH09GEM1_BH09GEM1_00400 [soil metagenome]